MAFNCFSLGEHYRDIKGVILVIFVFAFYIAKKAISCIFVSAPKIIFIDVGTVMWSVVDALQVITAICKDLKNVPNIPSDIGLQLL